jgi:hypothetical protein
VDFLSNKQDVCVSIGGHGCPSNAGEKIHLTLTCGALNLLS